MKIGVIKEIKNEEYRVALTPDGAKALINEGHTVLLEENAGHGSDFSNKEYQLFGVEIVTKEVAWNADLVIKIKEPLEQEYQYLKENILFSYLHLAGVDPALTKTLLKAKTTAIAYETIEDDNGRFPLLAPMSAVAGNMAASVGSYFLAKFKGGKGVQMGYVQGKRHGKVMVLGNGTVGQHAAFTADGMGANVYIFDHHKKKFEKMDHLVSKDLQFVKSTPETIAEHIKDTDLLIGAVLQAGARAPHLVTEEMVKTMQPGSVIVDVSIDQGGCIETSRPTSHSDPIYVKHDVIHYCVSNMPGAYPRTSTIALTNETLPYVSKLANDGIRIAQSEIGLAKGMNTHNGYITYEPVAEALGMKEKFRDFEDMTIRL